MGVDSDQAAKAAVEWNNTLRDIEAHFDVLKQAASIALLPAFQEIGAVTKMVLGDWVKIFKEWKGFDDFKDYVHPRQKTPDGA